MSSLVRWLLAACLGGAAAFLIACGDQSGLLSSGQADNLSGALDGVAAAVDKARCDEADTAGQHLGDVVRELPDDVDARLLRKLREGVATVSAKARTACQNQTPTVPTTTTQTTPTETTTTEPTTTPTVPPASTPVGTTPVPPARPATTPTTPGTSTGGGGGSGGAGPTS